MNPPELTEDELSAILDGEADDRLLAHVRDCPYCAARLEEAGDMEWLLSTALYRGDCPDVTALQAYANGSLDAAAVAAVAAHLDLCPYCQRDLASLRGEGHANRSVETAELNKLVMFPELMAPPKRAVRGGQTGWQMVAKAGTTIARLSIDKPEWQDYILSIQVSSPEIDWTGGMVSVFHQGEPVAVGVFDTHLIYECSLPEVNALSLILLSAGEDTIQLTDIDPHL
jgi:hypothetical protein